MQMSVGLKPLMALICEPVCTPDTPHSWLPLRKHPLSDLCGEFLRKPEGTWEGNGTCFVFFCSCIPFELWYEVDHACCSSAFKASRIPHLGLSWETSAGTVYTSVLPYVCKYIFCMLLDIQLIYCHILCL